MTSERDAARPFVVKAQPPSTTIQTRGMERVPGVTSDTVGASRLWLGTVTAAPNEKGPPHHHGEAETGVYVLRGRLRVYFGENFEEYIEAEPGDFIWVPPFIHHIEENPYDEVYEAVLARSPDNIVVNLAD
jgi:uncharacterized RmlC-like cupin family protein